MALTYGELPESPRVEFITCDNNACVLFLERFSACRGDYFMVGHDEIMRCGECGGPMLLARAITTVVPVAG